MPTAIEPPPAAPTAATTAPEHAPGDFMAQEMQDFADMDAGKPTRAAAPPKPSVKPVEAKSEKE